MIQCGPSLWAGHNDSTVTVNEKFSVTGRLERRGTQVLLHVSTRTSSDCYPYVSIIMISLISFILCTHLLLYIEHHSSSSQSRSVCPTILINFTEVPTIPTPSTMSLHLSPSLPKRLQYPFNCFMTCVLYMVVGSGCFGSTEAISTTSLIRSPVCSSQSAP